MKWMKRVALGIMGAAGGLLLYCGSFYVKCYMENRKVQEKYEMLKADCLRKEGAAAEISEQTEARKEEQIQEEKVQENQVRKEKVIKESFGISWEKLLQINPDIVAWVTVPEADISYPVVQGDDDEYYLNHSISGEETPFGSIFLGSDHNKDFLDSHSFLYGHNMEGNMMFANLNRYKNKGFLDKCPEFYVITPQRKFHYEIFSIEQAEEGSMCFRYGYEPGSEAYEEQLKILKENSMYDTGVEPDIWQRMVTLITCNSRLDEHVRMAVHGICREIIL